MPPLPPPLPAQRGRRPRGRHAPGGRRAAAPAAILLLTLLATLLGAPLVATWAAAATAATASAVRPDDEPLVVHLDSISPPALTDNDRPVRITGTVTNQSTEPWTGVNLYAIGSAAPIVDATSLAASATIDPEAFVGERVVEAGTFDTVELLQPGQTAGFSIKVPRDQLGMTEPGVYWLGVHAIGDSSVPRDQFADGRARTFIPVVARTRESVDAAIVLPVREQVRHTAGGRVSGVRRWSASLGEGGRLESLLDAGEAATGDPLTWLVDPSVPATVARLAAGNPPRSLAADPAADPAAEVPEEGEQDADTEPTPTPLAPGAPLGPPAPVDQSLTGDKEEVARVAQAWLDRFRRLVAGQTVLSLPYGDLDVSAAAAHDPAFRADAVARGAEVMDALGIAHTPALAPPGGVISPDALLAAGPDSTVLLGDTSFAVPPDTAHSMVRLLGHKVVVTSSGAASGGPGPSSPDEPLALRQRLLSEAALRLSAGSTAPVVLTLPDDWYPQDPADLFTALDVPWLRPVTVADISARPAAPLTASDLSYTEEDAEAELDAPSFAAAQQLRQEAGVLAGVLTNPTFVRQQVTDEALSTLSVRQRPRAAAAAASARAATAYLDDQLGLIDIVAPPRVTLSSADGTLGATVVNGLDQPVTVEVTAESDGGLEVDDPPVLRLGPGARSRLLLDVTASRLGIHQVRLVVTDRDGTPLGGSASLPVRAAQVSAIIWYVLVVGAVVLFGAIAVRVVRQVRARRRQADHPADDAPEQSPTATGPGATT